MGDFVLGGFCPGGFCPGGFCPGGFCPGVVWGDFVLEPFLEQKVAVSWDSWIFRISGTANKTHPFRFLGLTM